MECEWPTPPSHTHTHTMSTYTSLCVQGLLGVFFKVEAVALFEDIEPALKECDDNGCKGFLPGVKYYDQKDVADAYAGAA